MNGNYSHNALDVMRIVKRRKIDVIFDPLQDLTVDQGRLREHLAVMHDAMPDRVNVAVLLISEIPDLSEAMYRAK